jgi:hypothetical protein
MIFDVLNFIKQKVEVFVNSNVGAEPMLVLSNPWSNNDANKNSSFLNSISLINVEEEKIFKTQLPQVVQMKNGNYYKKEPDLKLNLYILISAYNKNYEDGLKFISKIVAYFQQNNVFQHDATALHDDLPAGIEKIIVELYTASFEQQNQIWASLSTGYLPSVIYKVRMLIIDGEPQNKDEKTPIKNIQTAV